MMRQIRARISKFRACAESYLLVSFGNNDPRPAKTPLDLARKRSPRDGLETCAPAINKLTL
jgi:hypothetical protein